MRLDELPYTTDHGRFNYRGGVRAVIERDGVDVGAVWRHPDGTYSVFELRTITEMQANPGGQRKRIGVDPIVAQCVIYEWWPWLREPSPADPAATPECHSAHSRNLER